MLDKNLTRFPRISIYVIHDNIVNKHRTKPQPIARRRLPQPARFFTICLSTRSDNKIMENNKMLPSNLRCSDENCERMFMHSLDADEACSYSAIDVRTARGRFTTRALRLRSHHRRSITRGSRYYFNATATDENHNLCVKICKMFELFNQTQSNICISNYSK